MKRYFICLIIALMVCGCSSKREHVTKINNQRSSTAAPVTVTNTAIITEPDAEVIIYEKTLNKFLKSVGKIQGKAPYKLMFIHGEYNWSIDDARIEINPENPRFTAVANVNIGGMFSYTSLAEGKIGINYDGDKNKVTVKIEEAVFEVYMNILGKKLHISDIDAAKFYKSEFEFNGPVPMQSEISIAMPDETKRKIAVKTVKRDMSVEKGLIRITAVMEFENNIK